ncbi:hypothetical protein MBLNU457_g0399t1 [Dothideomycetes sp. NU457]
MPSLRPPKIHCFYCGTRTQYTKKNRIRQFECDNCEATNFLDENGDITDVPASPETQLTRSYATALPPNGSPPTSLIDSTSPSSDRLFCDLCLKNQHFLTQCLANYVPPESDADYESQFPEYKRNMERRYPPVCPKCEPKVRERIRKSAYAAKSDILTKALSRPATLWEGRSNWSTALYLVEIVRWVGLITQFVWHLLGVAGCLRNDHGTKNDQATTTATLFDLVKCFAASKTGQQLSARCFEAFTQAVHIQIVIAAVTCWYIPTMRTRSQIKTPERTTYYLIQGVSLFLRYIAWWALTLHSEGLSIIKYRGVHAFMLVTLIVLTYVASTQLRQPTIAPPVFRNFVDKPLIDKDSFQYPSDDFTSRADDQTIASAYGRTPPKPFPINRLAPKKAVSLSTGSEMSEPEQRFASVDMRSRTVGLGQNRVTSNEDVMDWEPIQIPSQPPGFSTNARIDRPSSLVDRSTPSPFGSFSQPTTNPFYGQLPPAPKSMEHRLRNSANSQPAQFHPVPETKQQDWFQRMRLANSSWAAKDYVKTMPDPDRREIELAESKWTLQSDLDAATRGTGLEDLFNTSFNIADDSVTGEDPPSPRKKGGRGMKVFAEEGSPSGASAWTAVALAAAVVGMVGLAARGGTVIGESSSSIANLGEWLRGYAYGQY